MNAHGDGSSENRPAPEATTVDFRKGGDSGQFTAAGWSDPESNFRWMTGEISELKLEPGLPNANYILELDLTPFVNPPGIMAQRLTVSVNGTVIAQSDVAIESRFGYRIPAALLADAPITSIVLSHPDAMRPCDVRDSTDSRLLSLAVTRMKLSPVRFGISGQAVAGRGGFTLEQLKHRLDMDPARFIAHFESLGDNCEFGLVQRGCGAEVFLSLLRFAGMELPTLLRALDLGMRDFGDPGQVEIRPDDKDRPEFVTHETRYGAYFHTFRYQDETRADLLHASESKRLAYCAQRLIGDLKRGHKIFVIKRNEPLREDEVLPLYNALGSFGPNTLLWVVPADSRHAAGSVEVVLPGLLKGFIRRFAPPEDAPNLLLEDWLEICAHAFELRHPKAPA